MTTRILTGANITYSIVPYQNYKYGDSGTILDTLKSNDSFTGVIGCVHKGTFYSYSDLATSITHHWSLDILADYMGTSWVVIKKHPKNLWHPMANMVGEKDYIVIDYDVYSTDGGKLVAVATEIYFE